MCTLDNNKALKKVRELNGVLFAPAEHSPSLQNDTEEVSIHPGCDPRPYSGRSRTDLILK